MRGRLSSVLRVGAVAALVAGSVVIAQPAAAAGELEILYGSPHTTTMPTPLFADIALMVPRDEQSAQFLVRNTGDEAGFLRFALTNVSTADPVFAENLSASVSLPGAPGEPQLLSSAQPCRVLNEDYVLAPGEQVSVTMTMVFADATGAQAQNAVVDFGVQVSMTDARLGDLPPTECTGGSYVPGVDPLPATGSTASAVAWPLAGIALGAGAFFVVAGYWRKKSKKRD